MILQVPISEYAPDPERLARREALSLARERLRVTLWTFGEDSREYAAAEMAVTVAHRAIRRGEG